MATPRTYIEGTIAGIMSSSGPGKANPTHATMIINANLQFPIGVRLMNREEIEAVRLGLGLAADSIFPHGKAHTKPNGDKCFPHGDGGRGAYLASEIEVQIIGTDSEIMVGNAVAILAKVEALSSPVALTFRDRKTLAAIVEKLAEYRDQVFPEEAES